MQHFKFFGEEFSDAGAVVVGRRIGGKFQCISDAFQSISDAATVVGNGFGGNFQ